MSYGYAVPAMIAFLSGLILDSTSVWWVHFSEQGRAVPTAALATAQACAQVAGIGAAVRDWHAGVPFVLGYGLGAYLSVRVKSHYVGKLHTSSHPDLHVGKNSSDTV